MDVPVVMRATVRPLLPVRAGGTQVKRSTVSCIHSTQGVRQPWLLLSCAGWQGSRHGGMWAFTQRPIPSQPSSALYKTLLQYV